MRSCCEDRGVIELNLVLRLLTNMWRSGIADILTSYITSTHILDEISNTRRSLLAVWFQDDLTWTENYFGDRYHETQKWPFAWRVCLSSNMMSIIVSDMAKDLSIVLRELWDESLRNAGQRFSDRVALSLAMRIDCCCLSSSINTQRGFAA